MFAQCSAVMGSRNLTKRDIFEMSYPVRLAVTDYAPRAVRRTSHRAAHDVLGHHLYMMSIAHACRFACAAPEAIWQGRWPVRVVLAMERKHEWLVRDALRAICGDAGYVLEIVGYSGTLDLDCVWDAQLLARALPQIGLAGNRIRRR